MRLLSRLLAWLLPLAMFAVAAVILLPPLVGYERYVIRTASMTGTLDPGSVIFDKVVPVTDLRKGDIITYGPPGAAKDERLVTHRIFSIRRSEGSVFVRTKGDANDSPDPYEFTPDTRTLPRVDAHIPYLGYVYAKLNSRTGRLLIFIVPALLIAASALIRLWREAGDEVRGAAAATAGKAEG